MLGFYMVDEYDIVGFLVGVVEKDEIVIGEYIEEGYFLIGFILSGFYSNGFFFVRKVFFDDGGFDLDIVYEFFVWLFGEELLELMRIYVKLVFEVVKSGKVDGMVYVIGGGFIENILWMLLDGLSVEIDYGLWLILLIFLFLQEYGKLKEEEMFNVFNMGIGFVFVVKEENLIDVIDMFEVKGEKVYLIGWVKQGEGIFFGGVVFL